MTEPISDEALAADRAAEIRARLDASNPDAEWATRRELRDAADLTWLLAERDRLRKALEAIPATLQAIKEGDDAGEQAAVRETVIIGKVERALEAALSPEPSGGAR